MNSSSTIPRALVAIGITTVLAAALAALGPTLEGRSLQATDAYLALLAILTLMPLALALSGAGLDLFSPLPTLGGMMFAFFVLRGFYVMFGNPSLDELAPSIAGEYDRWLEPALLLASIAWVGALIGYFVPVGAIVADILPRVPIFDRQVVASRAFVIWCIGVVFKAVQIIRGTHLSFAKPENMDLSTQSYVDYLSRMTGIALFTFAALIFAGRLRRSSTVFLWAVILPFELLYAVLSGSRLAMFMPFVLLLLAYHYFHRRLRLRHMLGLGMLLGLVIVPLGGEIRRAQSEVQGSSVTDFDVTGSVEAAKLAGSSAREFVGEDDYLTRALAFTSGRLHGLDSLMVCLRTTPAFLPWEDKALYLMLPAMAVVPRLFWVSKPIMDAVPDFSHRYWGTSTHVSNAVAVSHVGSLYLAWGWWGAVIGMLVLGVFWRFMYEYLQRGGGAAGIVTYLNLLLVIVAIEGDVPSVYSGMIKMAIVMLATSWFLCPAVPDGRRVSGDAFVVNPGGLRSDI